MDRIYKNINIDNCRSHRSGLLPFVHLGKGEKIEEVNGGTEGGNFGHYVCDFTISDNETNKEIHRLKYLDVLSKYNFIQEQLSNAIFLKKYTKSNKEVTFIDCENDDIITNTTETPIWRDVFNELSTKGRYEFKPFNIDYFFKEKDNYIFIKPQFIPSSELTEEEKEEEESKFNAFLVKLENEMMSTDFCALIPNYDMVIQYNNEWGEWWSTNFDTEWETKVFDGYQKGTNVSEFKFCYDFEQYALGKIEVLGNFQGQRVPRYVFLDNLYEQKLWFESNSAATISAYESGDKDLEWIIKQWEDRGGDEFYQFLNGITTTWQTIKESTNGDGSKKFSYKPPYVELNTVIINEYDVEGLYVPYEYSIIDDVKENVVYAFEPIPFENMEYIETAYIENEKRLDNVNSYYIKGTFDVDGYVDENHITYPLITEKSVKGSSLTPHFITGLTTLCESRLEALVHPSAQQINGKLMGIFDEYDGNHGQLFKCTFHSGWSVSPEIIVYCSSQTITYQTIDNGDGSYEKIPINIKYTNASIVKKEEESYPTPKGNPYQIVCAKAMDSKNTIQSAITEEKTDEYEITSYFWSASTETLYTWWECEKYSSSTIKCADGESVQSGDDKKYRNLTLLSCLRSMIGSSNGGDTYYIMARFKNGIINPRDIFNGEISTLKFPYKVNEAINVETYDDNTVVCDMVESYDFDNESGVVNINYVLGATSGKTKTTGIHYVDTVPCVINKKEDMLIDGSYMAEIYYDKLQFNEIEKVIYSEEYDLERTIIPSTIHAMEVGTVWSSSGAVNTMFFTQDYFGGMKEVPKTKIDLLYNRGNAAAWEKHFKLMECNTMEDLENYGNNFFNI